ncbi:V-type ATP synthase subunit E [Clostridium tertium]|jgi:V/A-type H+/Na+-transporting ATPase subunit E|uniref:V-type ATP synthase subunit E n=1 Tax=Clostridium TaxID=1485 RepID=UPI00115BC00A|nr:MULTISPECIES: V-type ATP synthase subunit E [Clostridium]MBS5307981.1 V-type ATP synthase subunit E [Clostridium sp.]MBS6501290.1 V-type ATP synthase subunit E [Clostridium sp.]MDB1921388.1 V-type ATP synthase subunit E [Clostridium tertium]MDB1924633.1 V-type ATP synthase subunit E [Clostridium tertium]MDB1928162.1 V-type ATP synthase subunit E [Clostridium tertium]
MASVNNLTSKILRDAEERKESILASAEEEKNNILSKKIAKAKELEKEIIQKAELEAKTKKERILSSASLKVRNNKLSAKQEVIKEVFEKSIDMLATISGDDFLRFIKNSILSLGEIGEQTLILNKEGMEVVDLTFIYDLNQSLGDKGNIKLSPNTGNFKGGFILESNGIEINNTYEALVSSLKDELEFEVARVLFN